MKVIETIDNIDFILADENSISFINDKALVKLVGLAKSGHHFNEEQDRKLSSIEFKDLLCSFTDDERLLYTLVNRYQNVILDTEVYALIDRDFKECELTVNEDVYLSEFIADVFKTNRALCNKSIKRVNANDFLVLDNLGYFHIKLEGNNIVYCELLYDKYKETNLPNVLNCGHQLYNLDTMQESRYYDYIGDFEEFVKKDGTVYNASHAVRNIAVKEVVDGIERTKSCALDFYINEEGKIISPIATSIDNHLLIGGDSSFEEILDKVTKKLSDSVKKSTEESFTKRFLITNDHTVHGH